MPFHLNSRLSLKVRLSWGVAAVVLLATFAIATIALHHVRQQLEKSITEDLFQRLSAISDAIDLKFQSRRTLLKTLSDGFESVPPGVPTQLQPYIEKFQSLRDLFDNVSVIDPDGNVVANLGGALPFGAVNVADREYFTESLKLSKGIISQPYKNRYTGLPQVTMTELVWNPDGSLRYLLYGAINLKDQRFLDGLQGVKFGNTGYLFILNSRGIIVDLPDKSRILQHVDAQGGTNMVTERAIAGFEGTTTGPTRAGVLGLYAFKRTHETDWILGAFFPEAEAFASVNAIEKNAWGGALLLSVAGGLLAAAVIRQQLKPLGVLHDRMRNIDTTQDLQTLVYRPDEIGSLAKTFDELMRKQKATEQQIRTIIDNIPALVSHVDTEFRYTFINARVRDLYPDSGDLLGRSVQSVRGGELFAQVAPHLQKALEGESVVVERLGSTKVGDVHHTYQAHYIPDIGPDGQVKGVFAMSFDTTALTTALHKQETSQHFLRTITDNIPALISYFDRNNRIAFANATVGAWLGVQPEEIIGTHLESVIGADRYLYRASMIESAMAGQRVEFESELHLQGEQRFTRTIYVPDIGPDQQVCGVFSLTLDVTESKTIEKRLEQLARQDGLTRLPNRTELQETLPMAIARSQRTGVALAIMFLDIDCFKQINDEYGHGVGDGVLIEFANRLKNTVRVTDCVYRLGGDEFVIVMEHLADDDAATGVAEKIVDLIRSTPFDETLKLKVTTSIGVLSGVPQENADAKTLLEKADAALYVAKAGGRDRFHLVVIHSESDKPT
ncbi:MAG: diguanylate cyclase [Gammaproteobacteria bacterium]|nr:diguanylate cyclase [Gammaproteobacteria bacterium]MBU1816586.1 diguanylate cyclase [Gammaproteobacteria bacterium]